MSIPHWIYYAASVVSAILALIAWMMRVGRKDRERWLAAENERLAKQKEGNLHAQR